LATVEGQHRLILADPRKGLIDGRARDALRLRLAPHGAEERMEVPAALRGLRRDGPEESEQEREQESHESACRHWQDLPSPQDAGIARVLQREHNLSQKRRAKGPLFG